MRWATPLPLDDPGVYAFALTDDPDRANVNVGAAPIAFNAVQTLLARRSELTLDGGRPDATQLQERVSSFWLADEPVVYVGKASRSLRGRVNQYYNTPLGARSPHAGGWFVKLLDNLEQLWIHFATTASAGEAELLMLKASAGGVSAQSRSTLADAERVMPFANLEWPPGVRKRHGIRRATGPLSSDAPKVEPLEGLRSIAREHDPTQPRDRSAAHPARAVTPARQDVGRNSSPGHVTQRITQTDIGAGRIRIPIGPTKHLFPTTKARLTVDLRGVVLVGVRWDPRLGPDRERSGVLSVPRAELRQRVRADERLTILIDSDHVYHLA